MKRARRAFLLTDAVLALTLVSLLLTSLLWAVNRYHRSTATLAESRHAIEIAEHAMAGILTGRTVEEILAQAEGLEIEWLEDAPLAGRRWVRITAHDGGRRAELIGLAPMEAAP